MHYLERPLDREHAIKLAEAFAEGCVRANIVTVEQAPEDSYPCCVGCGGFVLERITVTPRSLGRLQVQGAQELRASKNGHALDLACYQCAQRRLEGEEDATVAIEIEQDGTLTCAVLRPSKEEDEDMIKYAPQRNCPGGSCDCGEVVEGM